MEMIMCIVADVGVVSSLPSPSHNIVCLPADRFQMLMAGSRGKGAAGEEEEGGTAIHSRWGGGRELFTLAGILHRSKKLGPKKWRGIQRHKSYHDF